MVCKIVGAALRVAGTDLDACRTLFAAIDAGRADADAKVYVMPGPPASPSARSRMTS
jgi:hypothetical protein